VKRIIFTLLYNSGQFVLSRNFRTQNIGDINWILKNYNLSEITKGIDEILILDITRKNKNPEKFSEVVKLISSNCFIPLSVGGGISSVYQAEKLFKSGADKIFLNKLFFSNPNECKKISSIFGKQSIIGGIDFKKILEKNVLYKDYGVNASEITIKNWVNFLQENGAGEIIIQSISNDGEMNGYAIPLIKRISRQVKIPVVALGGAGNINHLKEAYKDGYANGLAAGSLFVYQNKMRGVLINYPEKQELKKIYL